MLTNFLVNKFVKDKENVKDKDVRGNYGNLASIVGLICNITLAISKIAVGLIANSVSILGDGINQSTDSFSSILAIVSFKISKKPADREHPYGHARYEYILSSIVSLIVVYVGVKLLVESIKKIFNPGTLEVSIITISVLIFSIIVKLWMYRFYSDISKKINSDMLKATAIDARADVYATGAILLSTIIYPIFNVNLDSYTGILVSILIIKSGVELLTDVGNKIVGIRPSSDQVIKVEKYFLNNKRILNIHDLMFHDYGGNNKYITLHVEMDSNETLKESHALVDKIEKEIEKDLGYHVSTHVDPVDVESTKNDYLKKDVLEIIKKLRPDLKLLDFRVVEGDDISTIMFSVEGNISYDEVSKLEDEVRENLKKKNQKFDAKIVFYDQIMDSIEE